MIQKILLNNSLFITNCKRRNLLLSIFLITWTARYFCSSSSSVAEAFTVSPSYLSNFYSNHNLQRQIKSKHNFRQQSSYTIQKFDKYRNHDSNIKMVNPILNDIIQSTVSSTSSSSSINLSSLLTDMTRDQAESLAGPFFGFSLFPYLLFLYFLDYEKNNTPKGVTIGFATCLLFVFLTIPAAIAAQVLYNVSLADCDWLHGSAESLLTITNLVTVVAFRQSLSALQQQQQQQQSENGEGIVVMPKSAISYTPMIQLVVFLTVLAFASVVIPVLGTFMGSGSAGDSIIPSTFVHTPYLGGFMDLPKDFFASFSMINEEPDNALTVACWIIHISSLVEFLVAMGFAWRWADASNNQKWKGLTWGLLPLHTSGIIACTYHLFYNRIPFLVPLQAMFTCIGNTTAAFAAYRIAESNGWNWSLLSSSLAKYEKKSDTLETSSELLSNQKVMIATSNEPLKEHSSLIGFEDLGDALAQDNDYTFLVKLFIGCAVASYGIKYGELLFDFPFDANIGIALSCIFIPSMLNAYKWYRRSLDPTFEGWF